MRVGVWWVEATGGCHGGHETIAAMSGGSDIFGMKKHRQKRVLGVRNAGRLNDVKLLEPQTGWRASS
jgi:hypothetical protein